MAKRASSSADIRCAAGETPVWQQRQVGSPKQTINADADVKQPPICIDREAEMVRQTIGQPRVTTSRQAFGERRHLDIPAPFSPCSAHCHAGLPECK